MRFLILQKPVRAMRNGVPLPVSHALVDMIESLYSQCVTCVQCTAAWWEPYTRAASLSQQCDVLFSFSFNRLVLNQPGSLHLLTDGVGLLQMLRWPVLRCGLASSCVNVYCAHSDHCHTDDFHYGLCAHAETRACSTSHIDKQEAAKVHRDIHDG